MNRLLTFFFIIASLNILPANSTEDFYELALKSYQDKDTSTAEIHLKNALKDNPKNLPAKILLAEVYIEQKLPHLAEIELNNALLEGADFNLVVELLAKSLLFQGKYEDVIMLNGANLNQRSKVSFELIKAKAFLANNESDKAKAIYQSMPKNIRANIGLANMYIDLNSLSQAQETIHKVEDYTKTDHEYWLVKGRWLLMSNKFTQALVFFDKANIVEPDNVTTLKYLVNTYIGLKEYSKAEKIIEQILILSPDDPHAQFLKSSILQNLDKTALSEQVLIKLGTQLASFDSEFIDSQPQLQLIDAMTSYAQKNWEQARGKLNSYLDNKPDDISATVLLADVYLKQNQGQKALELLSDYEEQLIFTKDYAIILAGLYIKFNKNFKAQPYLEKLNQQYPNDSGLLILTAKVLSEQDKDLEALTLLKEAKVSKDALYLQTLAAISLKLGKLDESQNYVTSLISLAPENIEYQLLHAQLLLKQGNISQATDILTQLYFKHADNAGVRFNYAILQSLLKEKGVARKILRQLVIDNKEYTQAWLKLAELEYELGEVNSAINIYQQQKKIDKVNKIATYQLAELYFSENDFEKSLSLINDYMQRNRLDNYAREIKAKNLIALNRTTDAKLQLSQLFGFWLNDAKKLLRLSRLQLNIKDYEGAEKSLAVALKLMPNNLSIFIETIKIQVKQGKLEEADITIKSAEKIGFKGNKYLLILNGDVARGRDNLGAAYSFYAKALQKDEHNVIALIKLTQISHNNKFSKHFIEFLTTLVNRYPNDALKRKILAEHLLTHERWDASQFQYQLLLTQPLPADQRAIALNNLAITYTKKKDYKIAATQAKQAIEITNTIPAFFDTAGWALTLSGNVNDGLSYLRQGYSMSSSNIALQYHLAYALVKLDRKEEAIKYLGFIVTAPDDIAEVKLAKQLLLELNQ